MVAEIGNETGSERSDLGVEIRQEVEGIVEGRKDGVHAIYGCEESRLVSGCIYVPSCREVILVQAQNDAIQAYGHLLQ
jgi:hypothetical protein